MGIIRAMSPDVLPRRFRLQFTLRSVFLLMTLVSLAFVIYRWPWEKITFEDPTIRIVGTFRRRLHGVPIVCQDGPERHYRKVGNREHLDRIHQYVDDRLVSQEALNEQGESLFKISLRDGINHGPVYSHERRSGQYENGKRVGQWRHSYVLKGEEIEVAMQFDADQPHGTWTWKTVAGKRLQAAEYDHGALTSWNGKPLPEAVSAWRAEWTVSQLAEELHNTPVQQVQIDRQNTEFWRDGGAIVELPINGRMEVAALHLLERDGLNWRHVREILRDRPNHRLFHALLEESLTHSQIPVIRFGLLSFVPIAEQEFHWQDQSGVSAVSFSPGAPEDLAWREPVVENLSDDIQDAEWRFQALFAGTPIQIDAVEFRRMASVPGSAEWERERAFGYLFFDNPSQNKRSRRDILGLTLSDCGWSCEQRGNLLILHPYPAEQN